MATSATAVSNVMTLFGAAVQAIGQFRAARASAVDGSPESAAQLPTDHELIQAFHTDAERLEHHANAILAKYGAPPLPAAGD